MLLQKRVKVPPGVLMPGNLKLQRSFSEGKVNNLLSQRGLGVGEE